MSQRQPSQQDYSIDHALLAIKEIPDDRSSLRADIKSILGHFQRTFSKDPKAAQLIDNLLYSLSIFWGFNPRESNWPASWESIDYLISVDEDISYVDNHIKPAVDACFDFMLDP